MPRYATGFSRERPADRKLRLFREAGRHIFPEYSSRVRDPTVRTMLAGYEVRVWEHLAQDVAKFFAVPQDGERKIRGKRPVYKGRGHTTRGTNSSAFSRDVSSYVKENTGIHVPARGYDGFSVAFYEEVMARLGL